MRHHNGEPLLAEEPQHFLAGAFIHIRQPYELGNAIAEALRDDPQRHQKAQQYRDYFFFGLDGGASIRTKAVIERLLAEGGHVNCP
jgi:hypothetical protein